MCRAVPSNVSETFLRATARKQSNRFDNLARIPLRKKRKVYEKIRSEHYIYIYSPHRTSSGFSWLSQNYISCATPDLLTRNWTWQKKKKDGTVQKEQFCRFFAMINHLATIQRRGFGLLKSIATAQDTPRTVQGLLKLACLALKIANLYHSCAHKLTLIGPHKIESCHTAING